MERDRTGSISSGRSRVSASKIQSQAQLEIGNGFEPCAATASIFLYALGKTIYCHHYDTLAIDKKFERHSEDVLLIAADNVSDSPGRMVASYDVGQTAIIWDLFTGDEIGRFASYSTIRVCAWMRNGNIAFGNSGGEVILFDPHTSEHISIRTIYDPITAIAPNSDCSTYALGYMNGSILIATLNPNFTIRHTLTTSRGPAPIVSLAWHGSARNQRTEMLATQTRDGDLRIWSVAKDPRQDTAKIVRILKRTENYVSGPNWLAWSKNGKIVQHSEGVTVLWDVKTKNVTYEEVPTIHGVAGIAVHGPTATLFTLGHGFSVQQFELNPPSLFAHHKAQPPISPPSPPVSIEDPRTGSHSHGRTKVANKEHGTNVNIGTRIEEGRNLSAMDHIAKEMAKVEKRREQRNMAMSTTSSVAPSHTASTDSRSSVGSRFYGNGSVTSKAETADVTVFSQTSSIQTGLQTGLPNRTPPSVASSQRSAQSRGSRLRHEVLRSPDPPAPKPLFNRISARLTDVPYRNPSQDQSTLTPKDLRLQMLSVVFAWRGDIDTLIRDEQVHHSKGSLNSIILAKWLGDRESDIMDSLGSGAADSAEWMLIALSSFNGSEATKKTGESLVRRLLTKGDVHTAVTLLIGLGDLDDAVEVYVSHKYYMEALLLTSLLFSDHWQRVSELLKKWGEHAVGRGQNQLAIRCFACTGQEPTEDWTSPRAQRATFEQEMQSMIQPNVISPASSTGPVISPASSGTGRMLRKGGALKLITSFDNQKNLSMSRRDDSKTPIVIAHTPMDTGITPGGFRSLGDIQTAVPDTAIRKRLTSIGEANIEATPETTIRAEPPAFPNLQDRTSRGSSDLPLRNSQDAPTSQEERFYTDSIHNGPLTGGSQSSRRMNASATPKPPSRGVSRDRKPEALNLESKIDRPGSRARHHRSNTESYVASPPVTGRSFTSVSSLRSPMRTGRTIDDYIDSLDNPNFTSQTPGSSSYDIPSRGRDEQKSKYREASESRGRSSNRYASSGKRSPSSPVPMSPDDVHLNPRNSLDDRLRAATADPYKQQSRLVSSRSRAASTSRPPTRPASRQQSRRVSPESRPVSRATSRIGGRAQSKRRQSPSASESRYRRDHGVSDGPQRSPSSPVPMSPHPGDGGDSDEDEERFIAEMRKRFRAKQRSASRKTRDQSADPSRARSSSRKPKERATTTRQDPYAEPSESRNRRDRAESFTSTKSYASMRSASARPGGNGPTSSMMKELAQQELEDRRKSLAQKSAAAPFPHPVELQYDDGRDLHSARDLALLRSKTVSPLAMSRNGGPSAGPSNMSIGLPATPRAMRHPKDANMDIPEVPEIPATLPSGSYSARKFEQPKADESFDTLAPLPSSTYVPPKASPRRAASAPPEEFIQQSRGLPANPAVFKHHQPFANQGDDDSNEPPASIDILPELQHLRQATYQPPAPPPPPPPPPSNHFDNNIPPPPPLHHGSAPPSSGIGVINIAIDGDGPSIEVVPQPVVPAKTSPTGSHRGRHDASGPSLSNKLRERMRSASRTRTRSPTRAGEYGAAPYESIGGGGAGGQGQQVPPLPTEQAAVRAKMASAQGMERHPREVRAELTPEMAKLGFTEGGMI